MFKLHPWKVLLGIALSGAALLLMIFDAFSGTDEQLPGMKLTGCYESGNSPLMRIEEDRASFEVGEDVYLVTIGTDNQGEYIKFTPSVSFVMQGDSYIPQIADIEYKTFRFKSRRGIDNTILDAVAADGNVISYRLSQCLGA